MIKKKKKIIFIKTLGWLKKKKKIIKNLIRLRNWG